MTFPLFVFLLSFLVDYNNTVIFANILRRICENTFAKSVFVVCIVFEGGMHLCQSWGFDFIRDRARAWFIALLPKLSARKYYAGNFLFRFYLHYKLHLLEFHAPEIKIRPVFHLVCGNLGNHLPNGLSTKNITRK